MGNTYTLNAAETSEIPAPPPIGSPPIPVDPAPPSSQTILSAVSNNPGVFEDLHKKCKGIFLNKIYSHHNYYVSVSFFLNL